MSLLGARRRARIGPRSIVVAAGAGRLSPATARIDALSSDARYPESLIRAPTSPPRRGRESVRAIRPGDRQFRHRPAARGAGGGAADRVRAAVLARGRELDDQFRPGDGDPGDDAQRQPRLPAHQRVRLRQGVRGVRQDRRRRRLDR
ncbi:hypothetical protein CURTO8I2_280070 [Curtobacterium sp. 8I-2]|nr:hypothetical protein CURTO8I2_280070 [Curtobacterium sp. 8I-2]